MLSFLTSIRQIDFDLSILHFRKKIAKKMIHFLLETV